MTTQSWRRDQPNARPTPPAPDTTRLEYERGQSEQAWRHAAQAGTQGEALRWLERAWRFTPSDRNLAFALASKRLEAGDMAGAGALFRSLAGRHGGREILAGLAVCALAAGDLAAARQAVARALATTVPDTAIAVLAARLSPDFWCGLTLDGELTGAIPEAASVMLDNRAVPGAGRTLPADWRRHAMLRVTVKGRPLLGSPIDIRAITQTDGYVALTASGIEGWAWHPADPARDPVLTIEQDGRTVTLAARDLSVEFRGTTPLARPRGFTHRLDTSRPLRVMGGDGRDLLGSPLGGPTRARPAPRPSADAATAVIVPVYRGLDSTLACLRSVLATIGPRDRLIVVNDASPDAALAGALRAMQAEDRITLIASDDDPTRNVGFPAAANAGLIAAGGSDAVLLNSDTIVYPGWLETLRSAVHSAPDIGTATPLSNDATIFTYPDPSNPAKLLPLPEGARLAALTAQVNAGLIVDVPTGHGFCLYIRAACLHAAGLLRDSLFAQGYGEENDFCERAARRGWRHVAVPSVYVGHEGGVSFGQAKHHLLARNGAILRRLHPSYRRRIDAFIAADPLLPARTRLDEARLISRVNKAGVVLLIGHAGYGGTGRVLRERAEAIRGEGLRPVTLRGQDGFTTIADAGDDTPNLHFRLPDEAPSLHALLARLRPCRAEIHHLSGHQGAILDVLRDLGLAYTVWVHDYQWICARMTLVTGDGKFCGEAPVEVCRSCVARWGDAQEVPLTPDALRERSRLLLPGAASVIAPSQDVQRRMHRHFPDASTRVAAWEAGPPPRQARVLPGAGGGGLTVVCAGAIGMEKGYEILLACARDAAARNLALHFAIAGYTVDDAPLLETGRVFVTGPFKAHEANAVIAGTGAQLAFLPSIWPETWCFALSDIWNAGLDAAVFDIGAPAERVRQTGRGWVLPLGLPPARVNDALLNLQALAGRSKAVDERPASTGRADTGAIIRRE